MRDETRAGVHRPPDEAVDRRAGAGLLLGDGVHDLANPSIAFDAGSGDGPRQERRPA